MKQSDPPETAVDVCGIAVGAHLHVARSTELLARAPTARGLRGRTSILAETPVPWLVIPGTEVGGEIPVRTHIIAQTLTGLPERLVQRRAHFFISHYKKKTCQYNHPKINYTRMS